MKPTCGACGNENREGCKFCTRCGVALACPACGAPNEPGDRFCGECGARLNEASSMTAEAASPGVVGAEVDGERKQLTVLFADV
ncbi:MAG TPA: zinc ribbon domain-containing protein, partial [Pseudonocardiaceae bacterium]|nr:zinc ribbon domain-containing protein [Pseudonocardiaceae bacterium]